MHTRIMLLTIGAALLLTTCGQMRNSSIEKTSPPTPAVQEEARQPQATPEPTMTAQEPDTVLITVQEQPPKENTHQEESTPQTAARTVRYRPAREARKVICISLFRRR